MDQKKVMLVADNRPLQRALSKTAECNVIKSVPYVESMFSLIEDLRPDVLVFSPYLQSRNNQSLEEILHNLSILEQGPQVILLAGNMDARDAVIELAISCEIKDFVFNPPPSMTDNDEVMNYMVQQIVDRILNPRNRRRMFEELGIDRTTPIKSPVFSPAPDRLTEHVQFAPPTTTETTDATAQSEPTVQTLGTNQSGVQHVPLPEKSTSLKPYIVGVISPSSSGATFIAQNVAATMALSNVSTGLIDLSGKRHLNTWLGRDEHNQSFDLLFTSDEIDQEKTTVTMLSAFTSSLPFQQQSHDWFRQISELPYRLIVLDLSLDVFGEAGLVEITKTCDEILFVVDMDTSRANEGRRVLDIVCASTKLVSVVVNKWMQEHLHCEISDLTVINPSYFVPFVPEVYKSINLGKPVVTLVPNLCNHFKLKTLS